MSLTTTFMGLKVWNNLTDLYDHAQMADNWDRVDKHDHSSGKGVQIPTGGIVDGAVTSAKIDPTLLPILQGSARTLITATEETRTSTSYGTLTTADLISSVVLPLNGMLLVTFKALWKQTGGGTGSAAIFLGANQLKVPTANAAPAVQEATTTTTFFGHLSSVGSGLAASASGTADSSDVTTGESIPSSQAGGFACIFAAAGTYDISVQFKVSSGTVTVKERKLWVQTIGAI